MTLTLRLLLAGLALVVLTGMLVFSDGFYSRGAILCAVAALGLALAACLCPERTWRLWPGLARPLLPAAALLLAGEYGIRLIYFGTEAVTVPETLVALGSLAVAVGVWFGPLELPSFPVTLLAVIALLFSGQAAFCTRLYYAEVTSPLAVMNGSAAAGFLVVACLPYLKSPRPRWPFAVLLCLLFLSGALLRLSAVAASPDPVIDAFLWVREAPRSLLRGENPYAVAYPNVYVTDRAYQYGVFHSDEEDPVILPGYPPLPILVGLPFSAAGWDVRYANVLGDLAAALVLLGTGWRRGSPLVGALAAGAFLHLPRAPFMIEQGWYEPMLAAALGGGLLLVERGRRVGYLLLGLGLTGKQYGLVLLAPLGKARRREWPRLVRGIALAVVAVLGPFFLWDPRAFLNVVLVLHLQRPPQPEAITLYSAALDLFGWEVPKPLLWAVAALFIGLITWRTAEQGTAAALWLGTALLVFFLCFTQGFFNYFYLCVYLLLLGITALASARGQQDESDLALGVTHPAS